MHIVWNFCFLIPFEIAWNLLNPYESFWSLLKQTIVHLFENERQKKTSIKRRIFTQNANGMQSIYELCISKNPNWKSIRFIFFSSKRSAKQFLIRFQSRRNNITRWISSSLTRATLSLLSRGTWFFGDWFSSSSLNVNC